MSNTDFAVAIEDLTVSFDGFKAIDNLNLYVDRGELRVVKPERNWSWGSEPRLPRIVIGAGTVVHGPMVFEHEVELFVHTTAKTGPVTGATAQGFSGNAPPAR